MLTLRPYQQDAIAKLLTSLMHGKNPVCALPTGSGKSVIIAELCNRLDGRVLVLSHRRELLAQNWATIAGMGEDGAGVYSAGLSRRESDARVVVGGVASVFRRMDELQASGPFRYILIDEAHYALSDKSGNTMYDQVLRACPQAQRVGMSATPYRMPDTPIWGSDGSWFDDLACEVHISDLTRQGFLAPLTGVRTASMPDLSSVRVRGGEFAIGDLSQASSEASVVASACDEILYLAQDRHHILIFCVDRLHASVVADALRERGCEPAIVLGNTESEERDDILSRFKGGRIRHLINVGVLTTGFDSPSVDCVAILRSTQSKSLFVQMAGRGSRLSPGKQNCIAEGQLVLSDRGLIPIQKIPLDAKVWDGVEWVSHDGPVYQGIEEVMTYAGLTATRDHWVYTGDGWQRFETCATGQIGIVQTGSGGRHIGLCDGHFAGGDTGREGASEAHVSLLPVHALWQEGAEAIQHGGGRDGGLRVLQGVQGPCEKEGGHALQAGVGHPTVVVPEGFAVAGAGRGALRIPLSIGYGCVQVGDGELGAEGGDGAGAHGQVGAFRAWQPHVGQGRQHGVAALAVVAPETGQGGKARRGVRCSGAGISAGVSGYKISGRDDLVSPGTRGLFRGDCRAVCDEDRQEGAQANTSMRVWDLANCGPRHRFTVSGLLVHNCLVLDAGGNLARHAPLDGIPKVLRSPKLAEAEKAEAVASGMRERERKARHEALVARGIDPLMGFLDGTSRLTLLVKDVKYLLRPAKKYPGRQNLLVSYRGVTASGMDKTVTQFVLLDYPGRPGLEAQAWFERRGLVKPVDAKRALAMAWKSARPEAIVVEHNGGWDRVVMEQFE